MVNNDVVDVVVYDRALTASGTIDPAACSAISSSTLIRTVTLPVINLNTTDGSSVICENDDAFMIASAVASATYSWSINGT